MWQWIDDILAESQDFNYLFVAGHYQVKDARGDYDAAMVHVGIRSLLSLFA